MSILYALIMLIINYVILLIILEIFEIILFHFSKKTIKKELLNKILIIFWIIQLMLLSMLVIFNL